jgi:two-component system response regulator PilR (NtrC family)
MSQVLIIDDEPDIRELLKITLERMEISCDCADNISTAKSKLKSQSFDLCLTDMKLPDGNGLDLVAFIQKKHPDLPVAVITAHGNMEIAVTALKSGAFDFISKPIDLSTLRNIVKNALKLPNEKNVTGNPLIGTSEEISHIHGMVAKLSRSQAPVYISGESGVGKELVARMIHENGPRERKPFIPVNCGAIPNSLMESEFFGHTKGSFTGADSDKDGLFKAADGGSLFLDEVAELPSDMQVKLLRAIQEKKIRPIGGHEELPVDIRLLCATHKNLYDEVEKGTFRKDFYYRINVIELNIPPLRQRPKDIPVLVDYILERMTVERTSGSYSIADSAMKMLKEYSFPGNVRELQNILERAVTLCEDNEIKAQDLSLDDISKQQPLPSMQNNISLEAYLEEIERKIIQTSLAQTKWNITEAAKKLGTSFRSLRYRINKLNINKDDN